MATTIGSLDLNAFSDLYSDSTQYFWFESNASATYGAGAHVTLVPDTTFISNPTGQNILMNTDGFSIRNGLLPMMTLDNDSLDFNVVDTIAGTYTTTATFTATGAQIGQSGGAHSIIDADGQRFYASDGTTQLANIGYGEGTSSSGTVNTAPYFTFGTRIEDASNYNSSETYAVGDVVRYNGSIYVCYEKISTPEPFDSNKWGLSIGNYSYASGELNLASGSSSHAEGASTKAIGVFSHAEGFSTKAIGTISHSEGWGSSAFGSCSHAEGASVAKGDYSHSQNYLTEASFNHQTVIGRYNDNQQDTAFEIGNGTSDAERSNAFTVDWNGNVIGQAMAGIIQMYAGATPPTGWLICDGTSYLRSDYPTLFAALGGTSSPWGLPDSTHFKVPDLRGRVPIGAGTGSGLTARTLGTQNIGSEDAIVPYHRHSVSAVTNAITGGSHNHDGRRTANNAASGSNRYTASGSVESGFTTSTETHTHDLPAHNTNYEGTSGNEIGANMQPSAVVNFIICTGKTS